MSLTFENDQSQPTAKIVKFETPDFRLTFQREHPDQFFVQMAGTREQKTFDISDEDTLRRIRKSVLGRNSIIGFYETAIDWSFSQMYRKQRQKGVETDETRIARLMTEKFLGLFAFDAGIVYAAAPFRTKPERTYSPVEAASSAEGTHIPISLAQAKSFEKQRWNILKEKIESFGVRSNMFKKIDIKRLGKLDSDPFQLIINVSKDNSNIVDVGYGVSQLLPLIVETIINEEAEIFLFQQPEVHLHPRGQAELGSYFLDFAIKNDKYIVIETHSDYIIDRIRTDIVRMKLNPDDYLSLLYFERADLETRIRRITVAEDGSIVNPPDSYRRFFIDETMRTFGM